MADIKNDTLDTAPDATILKAWEDRKAAYDRYNALPLRDNPTAGYTPDEQDCWDVIDAADQAIRSAVATTPAGISVQVWAILYHGTNATRADDAALQRGDLAYFEQKGDSADWILRLGVAALQSLKAMEARHG